ncbi:uncharacterized protein [Littorina saxatilis]|uniref:uncharacterized protein n=1 Tax=Littorina saxatilis TaxID=31220 RepID=UPI0038B6687E
MVYLVMLCACSALSVLLTVLVLSLHHRPDSLPLTKRARVFVRLIGPRVRVRKSSSSLRETSLAGVAPAENSCDMVSPVEQAGGARFAKFYGRQEDMVGRSGSAEMTWRDVAAACDFLFSRFFLVVIAASTLVFFVVMTV